MTYQNAAAIIANPATAIIERAPITRAFEIVTSILDTRYTVPILGNARITGDLNSIFITTTDQDAEISVSIPADVDSRFALAQVGYNAGYLTDIVATASPDGAAVTWGATNHISPCRFTGSREGWMAVLMPMRV